MNAFPVPSEPHASISSPNSTTAKLRRGVLLINLGSPDSPGVADVRRYLHQFLMDPRVLDAPWLLRKLIVVGTILPSRPRTTARAYQSVWMEEGAPLVVISRRVQRLLQARLEIPVALAMRYGFPSIESGLRELIENAERPIDEILLAPLYPHYAISSYETAVVEARKGLAKLGSRIPVTVLPPFYDHSLYIEALVESARPYLAWDYDRILFSYHGLPERHIRKADPTGRHCLVAPDCCALPSPAHATCYRAQVLKTTDLFVKKAGIAEGRYGVAFQSRLGRDPWLKPYTDLEIERMAREGVKKLLVICPAFVSDCLETLEEIGIRGREAFVRAGGEELRLIPCMNDHPAWIEALRIFCTQTWPDAARGGALSAAGPRKIGPAEARVDVPEGLGERSPALQCWDGK